MSTNYYIVDSESRVYHRGIFLGKTSGGWVPQLKWHEYQCANTTCMCQNNTHVYRSWDEMIDYIRNNGLFIKNEYGSIVEMEEFIQKFKRMNRENSRIPDDRRSWKIDGWYFVRGNWL